MQQCPRRQEAGQAQQWRAGSDPEPIHIPESPPPLYSITIYRGEVCQPIFIKIVAPGGGICAGTGEMYHHSTLR